MNDSLPNPVSFEIALEKFLGHLKKSKRSSATIIAYGSDLVQLKNYLFERRITQATTIQTPHLQDFVKHMTTQGYTAKSVSRKINSLKTFFKFLISQSIVSADPATHLAHPKYQTAPPRILTPTEYKALRDACRLDIRMAAIVELLLQIGIRISELANTRVSDIGKNELTIRPLENNPARTIALSKSAMAAIQNYLAIRAKVASDHLFVTKTGRPLLIRNIRTAIDRYFRIAGIKGVKVNDLRHTFVAHQLSNGVDPEFLSKAVGHKRLTSTSKYLNHVTLQTNAFSSKLIEL